MSVVFDILHITIDSAGTLGIHTTYAARFHQHEVVPISRIDSALAVIPIYSQLIACDLWVLVSFDRVIIVYSGGYNCSWLLPQMGNENDNLFDEEEEGGEA